VIFVPAVIISVILINFVDLEKLKESKFGKYFKENSGTKTAMIGRILGVVVSIIGAWFHSPVLIVLGILSIIFAWTKGLVKR